MTEDDTEKFEISCPICKSNHIYSIKISKAHVFFQMSRDMNTSPNTIKVNRIFTCPNNNKEFQATLKLMENFGEKIDGVEVQ